MMMCILSKKSSSSGNKKEKTENGADDKRRALVEVRGYIRTELTPTNQPAEHSRRLEIV